MLQREGRESPSGCKCVCYVFFYGKLMMPGVITASIQRFLYIPDVFASQTLMYLDYWIIFIYKLDEFSSSVTIMDGQ